MPAEPSPGPGSAGSSHDTPARLCPMGPSLETIGALVSLVEEWRRSTAVFTLVHELGAELAEGEEPFVGRPIEREHVRDRLPAGVASA